MTVVVTGLNHKTAPVTVRERLYFPEDRVRETLPAIVQGSGIREIELISTCNRTEVHFISDSAKEGTRSIKEFFAEHSGLPVHRFEDSLYHHVDHGAVRHLFRLASSLDSMVVGEPQITSQLKQAYSLARELGTVQSLLDRLVTTALSVSKRVRTETAISESAVSIPYAAVELAKKIFSSFDGLTVGILGTGKMGQDTLKNLLKNGVAKVISISHNRDRADHFIHEYGGLGAGIDELPSVLPQIDILIACTTNLPNTFAVTAKTVASSLSRRSGTPLFLIDIAVPRNLDPAISDLDTAFLYDIDDLKKVISINMDQRAREAQRAEVIVDEETEQFMQWYSTRAVTPVIAGLHQKAEAITDRELQKLLGRLQHLELSAKDEQSIRGAIRGALKKMLHEPTMHLREPNGSPPRKKAGMVAELFNLDDAKDDEE